MKALARILTIVFAIFFLIWSAVKISHAVSFDRDIKRYLSHAAEASTIQLAKENLDIALKNIEGWGLTSGHTTVLFESPEDDVGFWYKNVKASRAQLDDVKTVTFQEQKTVLAELRKTLLSRSGDGSAVVIPQGISIYPKNRIFALLGTLNGVLVLAFWLLGVTYIPPQKN